MIRAFLIIQVPDTSDKRGVSVAFAQVIASCCVLKVPSD